MGLRITTWNVNGIRNPFGYQPWRDKRTFDSMFDILQADIVVMQELKIQKKDLRDDMVLVPGWDCFFSLPKHKKGYSGVGIYTRQSVCAPIRAEEGVLGVLSPPGSTIPYCDLPEEKHIGGYLSAEQLIDCGVDAAEIDSEGRCVVLEFPAFVIFGLYVPANTSGMRDDFRHGFFRAVDTRVRNLIRQGKRVIVTGDLNITQGENDTANAKENMKKEGVTYEEWISTPNRRLFNHLLEGGDVIGEREESRERPAMFDICRGFHPTREGMYTHWDTKINARPGNFGSRIDFILCSLDMKSWFCESDIQEGLMGSDHCPVYAVMKDQIDIEGKESHIKDYMSASGMFKNGERQRDYSIKDIPSFSAKLLPEFDKRRSIKDMFSKKPILKPINSVDTPTLYGLAQPSPTSNDNFQSTVAMEISTAMSCSQQTVPSTASNSPINTPERKRSLPQSATTRPLKRTKSNASSATTATKGQQSLKGFFKSSVPTLDPATSKVEIESRVDEATIAGEFRESVFNHKAGNILAASPSFNQRMNEATHLDTILSQPTAIAIKPDPPPPPDPNVNEDVEDVHDPIVSKESWGKLFSKPPVPLCESHEEPCKMMKTGKKGFNCGREFYMCARPLGPTGSKERNTEWRCPTFIWTSNWNPSKQ